MSSPDFSPWSERRSGSPRRNEPDRADAFERDRARVIHSAAFRRLQGKTQVLGISEGDFHRTRLTHSMEVSQIGRGIVAHLKADEYLNAELRQWLPSEALIEAVCLAHDLGHPPFGHGGEVALDHAMRHHGGFEGNGQTLRMVARLEPHTSGFGLDLTRRALLGVLKYPAPYSSVVNRPEPNTDPRPPLRWHPPKCYHDDEKDVVDFILAPFSEEDRALFLSHQPKTKKDGMPDHSDHRKTQHKALDTTIMELADDIAYGVHDLEDGVALELITREDWVHGELDEKLKDIKMYSVADRIFGADHGERKLAIGDLIYNLLKQVSERSKPEFSHPLLCFNISLSSPARAVLDRLNDLTREKMIFRPQVRSLEWRGQEQLRQMFEVFMSHGDEIMPAEGARARLIACDPKDIEGRSRAVCDFIAGMTDEYAMRMYERLFLPRGRSAFERI